MARQAGKRGRLGTLYVIFLYLTLSSLPLCLLPPSLISLFVPPFLPPFSLSPSIPLPPSPSPSPPSHPPPSLSASLPPSLLSFSVPSFLPPFSLSPALPLSPLIFLLLRERYTGCQTSRSLPHSSLLTLPTSTNSPSPSGAMLVLPRQPPSGETSRHHCRRSCETFVTCSACTCTCSGLVWHHHVFSIHERTCTCTCIYIVETI